MTDWRCPICNQPSNVRVISTDDDRPPRCMRCSTKEKRARVSTLKVIRRERIPLRVGMTTLVGSMLWPEVNGPCPKCGHDHAAHPHYRGSNPVICMVNNCGGVVPVVDSFPRSRGNCCSLTWPSNRVEGSDGSVDYQSTGPSYACRNMNTENVTEAGKRWPSLLEGVEIEVLEDQSCRVIDERLPERWRRHYCSGCGYFEDPDHDDQPAVPSTPTQPRQGATELAPGFIYVPYIPLYKPPDGVSTDDLPRKLRTKWSMEHPTDLQAPGLPPDG